MCDSDAGSSMGGDDLRKSFNFGKGTKSESNFFEKLYQVLPDQFDDIIKVLKLYYDCVIGADETLDIVKPAFIDEPDLYEYFKFIILSREINRR